MSSQKDLSTTMRDVANQIVESQNQGQAALQPLLPLLQNMQSCTTSPTLPTAITPSNYATPQSSITGQDAKSHIPLPVASGSSRRDPIKVDLDDGFDRQDVDNLLELKLLLPSEVYETDTISQTLEKIKTYNKSIGQFLGTGPSSKKISNAKKNQLESQRDTLKKYRDRLENTDSAKSLVAPTKTGKYGKGVPNAVHEISFYSSVDDLCNRLALLCAAQTSGQ